MQGVLGFFLYSFACQGDDFRQVLEFTLLRHFGCASHGYYPVNSSLACSACVFLMNSGEIDKSAAQRSGGEFIVGDNLLRRKLF